MFKRRKQPPIRSLIADGSLIEGAISFAEGLRVDGCVNGNVQGKIEQPSILVISETASVVGEIHADHVIINGQVQGPVHARQMLELQPKARIVGNVYYKALEMHQGALIDGQLHPLQAEQKPTLTLAANNGTLNS